MEESVHHKQNEAKTYQERYNKQSNKFYREEKVESELRKQKENYTKSRLDQIKEQQRDLLETKS